jgi:hypothetical protein
MTRVSATHKIYGEQVTLEVENLTQLTSAWRIASEYEKIGQELKDKLKKLLPEYLDDSGRTDEVDGYRFTTVLVQRKNYDKAVLRQVLDEDLLDLFLKPDKTKIDNYIKEHLDELGENSGLLRDTMIEDGKPYSITRLEKLS